MSSCHFQYNLNKVESVGHFHDDLSNVKQGIPLVSNLFTCVVLHYTLEESQRSGKGIKIRTEKITPNHSPHPYYYSDKNNNNNNDNIMIP